MKKLLRNSLPFIIILLFSGSCTDFFSTSLAPWAARDPSRLIPKVTVDNVDELIELTENDPDLSLELLKKIGEAVDKASDDDKAKLQSAAIEAAVNSVGLGQTLINAVGDLSEIDTDDPDAAKDLVIDAINSMPNLEEASESLGNLLKDPTNFIETASADDIALAAILLLAGDAKKNGSDDMDEYIEDFINDPSDQAKLALELAEALEDKVEDLSESLKTILDGLNLWPKP